MGELTKKVISIYCAIRFCERSEERPLAQPEGLRRKEKKNFPEFWFEYQFRVRHMEDKNGICSEQREWHKQPLRRQETLCSL